MFGFYGILMREFFLDENFFLPKHKILHCEKYVVNIDDYMEKINNTSLILFRRYFSIWFYNCSLKYNLI